MKPTFIQSLKKSLLRGLQLSIALGGFAGLAGIIFLFYLNSLLPQDLTELQAPQYDLPTVLYDRHGVAVHEIFIQRRILITYDQLSTHLIQALIASEDRRFFQHWGIDPLRMLKAFWVNLRERRFVQGASTITQQTAKLFLLNQQKQLMRKLKEIVLALRIERQFSKHEILTLYLNKAFFGNAEGIEAAAQGYFGKHSAELSLGEAAMLVGILPSPARYSPLVSPQLAKFRRDLVLRRMQEEGFITSTERQNAEALPIVLVPRYKEASQATADYVELVKRQIIQKYGQEAVYTGGLKVFMAMDFQQQTQAQATLQKLLPESGQTASLEGSLISLDPRTGEVWAMVGKRQYRPGLANRALELKRPLGSGLAPLLYSVALEAGYTLSTPLATWEAPSPEPVAEPSIAMPATIRQALKTSTPVPAKLIQELGSSRLNDYARRFGLNSDGTTLTEWEQGRPTLTLAESIRAFAPFANSGQLPELVYILKIEDAHGKILEQSLLATQEVLSPETAFLIHSALAEPKEAPGQDGFARLGRSAFGWVGEGKEPGESWSLGGVPQWLVGVHVGLEGNSSLVVSKTEPPWALAVWQAFFQQVLRPEIPHLPFPIPPGIVALRWHLSGRRALACDDPAEVREEYFKQGSEPPWDEHFAVEQCSTTAESQAQSAGQVEL